MSGVWISPARAGTATALAAAAVVGLAGCGGAHQRAPPANTYPSGAVGSLRVSPARPTTRSTIAFRFTAPAASGVHGASELQYSLSVTGTGRPGCVAAREATAPRVGKGATATVTLGPGQIGGPWCTGRYSARAIELQRAHCTGHAPCPQYIRVVAIVARATFDVRRG